VNEGEEKERKENNEEEEWKRKYIVLHKLLSGSLLAHVIPLCVKIFTTFQFCFNVIKIREKDHVVLLAVKRNDKTHRSSVNVFTSSLYCTLYKNIALTHTHIYIYVCIYMYIYYIIRGTK
jgi:hypothetical protein